MSLFWGNQGRKSPGDRAERTAGELAVSGYTGQSQGQSEVLLVSDLLTLPWNPAGKLDNKNLEAGASQLPC
ncbi:hypothetical protein ES703_104500 [subsurface metagenome]